MRLAAIATIALALGVSSSPFSPSRRCSFDESRQGWQWLATRSTGFFHARKNETSHRLNVPSCWLHTSRSRNHRRVKYNRR